jgi:hypothetical protein
MKKSVIIIIFICVILLIIGLILMNNNKKNNHNTATEENIIYSTTYYFGLGSRKVKIYENGDVFDDLEIEDPNHKENFKFFKKLSVDELNSLNSKLQNVSDSNELHQFVIELVYGVKEFAVDGSF